MASNPDASPPPPWWLWPATLVLLVVLVLLAIFCPVEHAVHAHTQECDHDG